MVSREVPTQRGRPQHGKALVTDLLAVGGEQVRSLSWSLGHRVTVEADAARLLELDHRSSRRRVVGFEATDYSCILRLRTPVGREKFYGVVRADLDAATEHPDWVVDSRADVDG